jgi:hypothetical protein
MFAFVIKADCLIKTLSRSRQKKTLRPGLDKIDKRAKQDAEIADRKDTYGHIVYVLLLFHDVRQSSYPSANEPAAGSIANIHGVKFIILIITR